jgi:hypothetical protein
MSRRRADVLPGQLSLFSEDELAGCTLPSLGTCPRCASTRVYVQQRGHRRDVLRCNHCNYELGGPEGWV